MIGRDLITDWSTVQRGQETLHVLSVTDCVRDRFIKFWAWNDRAGFLAWTARERREEPLYEQRRVDEFLAALGPPRGTSR